MQEKEKTEILSSLITFNRDLEEIQKDISKLPWDSDQETITLSKKMIINVLERYLKHKINSYELETWAELIEVREDIGIESEFKDYINNIIFALANPTITFSSGEINTKIVSKFVEQANQL